MAGGTEFRFVTGGIEDAPRQARAAAGDRDVRIGGGVATIRGLGGSWYRELMMALPRLRDTSGARAGRINGA
jgi:hypothetical protein